MIPQMHTAEMRTLERSSHKSTIRCEVAPAGEDEFEAMEVTNATLILNEAGYQPNRTCVIDTFDEAAVTAQASVLGGWLKISQDLEFFHPKHLKTANPLGYFRIERIIKHQDGRVEIYGSDAGQMIVAHPALTLADKTFNPGQSVIAKMRALLQACWPAGELTEWTDTLLDTGPVADKTVTAATYTVDGARLDVIAECARLLGCALLCDVTGASVYKLRYVAYYTNDSGVQITRGQAGNFVGGSVEYDRAPITNQVHAVWNGQVSGAAAGIFQQQRRIVSYDEATSSASTVSPFGIQSAEVTASEIANVTEADTRAIEAITNTLSWSHVSTLDTTPIYGIEAGDGLSVAGVHHTVVGGSFDLTGAWQLQVERFEALRSGADHFGKSGIYYELDRSDTASWTDIAVNPAALNLRFKKKSGPFGWSATNADIKVVDGSLQIKTKNAGTVTVRAAAVVPVPPLRRVKTGVSLGSSYTLVKKKKGKGENRKKKAYRVSLYIVYGPHKWAGGQDWGVPGATIDPGQLSANKGKSVSPRSEYYLPAGGATNWGIELRFVGMPRGTTLAQCAPTSARSLPRVVGWWILTWATVPRLTFTRCPASGWPHQSVLKSWCSRSTVRFGRLAAAVEPQASSTRSRGIQHRPGFYRATAQHSRGARSLTCSQPSGPPTALATAQQPSTFPTCRALPHSLT
jgi:hypothetical protein